MGKKKVIIFRVDTRPKVARLFTSTGQLQVLNNVK